MGIDLEVSLEFMRAHPLDAARTLERLSTEDLVPFLEKTPAIIAANALKAMDVSVAVKCLEMMDASICAAIVEHLPLEIASVHLRRMELLQRGSILDLSPAEIAQPIKLLLQYPDGTAGALMDPMAFSLPEDIRIREALRRIRKRPQHIMYYIYVVSREHILVGVVNLNKLMLATPDSIVSSVMRTDLMSLNAHSGQKLILMNTGWQEFHALPVVDDEGAFLGAIRYETLRRIEYETQKPPVQRATDSTITALGDLLWVGVSGLVKGAASALNVKRSQ